MKSNESTVEIFNLIREWAKEKGIYEKGDIKTQSLKFYEEAGELARAVINDDLECIMDAIGDSVVVLTSVAKFSGLTIEQCIQYAYDQIKVREGEMKNGSFIKNK